MPRRKPDWGTPGQTGVSRDGVPWYVPDEPPGLVERTLYTLFAGKGTSSIPAGARFVPARTPAEVNERVMRKYRDLVVAILKPGEQPVGFIGCALKGDRIPQPPRSALGAKVGPNRLHTWWMGGGWESMAGELNIAVGGSGGSFSNQSTGPGDRHLVIIRTDSRVLFCNGFVDNPGEIISEYRHDQIGVRPGWQPSPDHEVTRVDVAFVDGSWLGLECYGRSIPGDTEGWPERDLIAELAGPPVTATVLPPI